MQTSSYAKQLSTIHRLTAPAIRSAIRDLPFASGDRVLDVGCGVGRHGLWLAEAVGRSGMVVGLDLSTEHLSAATNLVRGNPPPSRTTFVAGDLHALPFVDGAFDWIWCVDTLWPAFVAQEPVNAVSAFSRVVTNGGHLALVYWSSQFLLCGHPELEARLNNAFVATTPYLGGLTPEHQFMRALGWFARAGLKSTEARTHIANICGPLTAEQQEAVAVCCSMFWGELERQVSPEDWITLKRLTDLGGHDCVFSRPDYYGFITYTAFHGRVERDVTVTASKATHDAYGRNET